MDTQEVGPLNDTVALVLLTVSTSGAYWGPDGRFGGSQEMLGMGVQDRIGTLRVSTMVWLCLLSMEACVALHCVHKQQQGWHPFCSLKAGRPCNFGITMLGCFFEANYNSQHNADDNN